MSAHIKKVEKISHQTGQDHDHERLYSARREMEVLLSQVQCYHGSCLKLSTQASEMLNFLAKIDAQNSASEHKATEHRYFADHARGSEGWHQLQSLVTQAHATQENANGAFAIAHAVQLYAQASQNFANAALSIDQKANSELEDASMISEYSANTHIKNIYDRIHNTAISTQGIASSIQNSYHATRNLAEKTQEKADKVADYVNEVSGKM